MQGVLFGVTKGVIRRRPKMVYKNVQRYIEDLGEVNAEEAQDMEKIGYAILSDDTSGKQAVILIA